MEEELRVLAEKYERESVAGWAQRVRNLLGDFIFLNSAPNTAIPLGFISHVKSNGDPDRGKTYHDHAIEAQILSSMKDLGYIRVGLGDPEFESCFFRYIKAYNDLSDRVGKGNPSSREGKKSSLGFWILGSTQKIIPAIPLTSPKESTTVVDAVIMRSEVLSAFDQYRERGMPSGFGEAKVWFVLHPETGEVFPAKAVWGIVSGQHSSEFISHTARDKLRNLGFKVLGPNEDGAEIARQTFQMEVRRSGRDTQTARLARLAIAPSLPTRTTTTVTTFARNPDVVVEALFRAKGDCQGCGNSAPFLKRSDDMPYLEVHHIIPLANDGPDTLENVIALCPNCHRKAHHG